MADYKLIKFTRSDGRADLILNDPPENMLSVEMLEEIVSALDTIRDDDTLKVLLIRGEGGTFCSGVRTEDLMADRIGILMPNYSRMYDYLNKIRGLTIAAVSGKTIGFGAELASFCDVTFAADTAAFGFPHITMGVFPPIATAILPRLIGRNRALDWIVSGRSISAKEAVEAHMIARVIPSLVLSDYADRYADRVASFSAPAIVLAKKAVDDALYSPAMEALRVTEATYMSSLMNSLDPHEGLKASIEGRPPVWKDR